MCCPCPSSLKARSGADQQSTSGSRSCPKKTILLPSSSSTSSLSLHSEVTHSLLYLSVFVCLCHESTDSPSRVPPHPLLFSKRIPFCASDLTSSARSVNKNKTLHFPEWTFQRGYILVSLPSEWVVYVIIRGAACFHAAGYVVGMWRLVNKCRLGGLWLVLVHCQAVAEIVHNELFRNTKNK